MEPRKRENLGKLFAEALSRLGNISATCREIRIPRSYAYRHFRELFSPERKGKGRHPLSIADSVRKQIVELALENPEWGCVRLGYYLELKGVKISSPTVQKILTQAGLGKKIQREAARSRRLKSP